MELSILFLFSAFSRESRRKTATAVCLKDNERLFGDSALGVVRPVLTFPKSSLLKKSQLNLKFHIQDNEYIASLRHTYEGNLPNNLNVLSHLRFSLWRTPRLSTGTSRASWARSMTTPRWRSTRNASQSTRCWRTRSEAQCTLKTLSKPLDLLLFLLVHMHWGVV